MIESAELEPNCFYWAIALKIDSQGPQVVRITTEFGTEPEYWTVVIAGSDEHYMPSDFDIICKIDPPARKPFLWQAAG